MEAFQVSIPRANVIEDFESLQSTSRILGAEIVSSFAADHVV